MDPGTLIAIFVSKRRLQPGEQIGKGTGQQCWVEWEMEGKGGCLFRIQRDVGEKGVSFWGDRRSEVLCAWLRLGHCVWARALFDGEAGVQTVWGLCGEGDCGACAPRLEKIFQGEKGTVYRPGGQITGKSKHNGLCPKCHGWQGIVCTVLCIKYIYFIQRPNCWNVTNVPFSIWTRGGDNAPGCSILNKNEKKKKSTWRCPATNVWANWNCILLIVFKSTLCNCVLCVSVK